MKKELLFLGMLLMFWSSADAALLVPESGQTLGAGGHLKMHTVVVVDSDAPDQSLVVGADGTVDVGAISVDGDLLTVSVDSLNSLGDAIDVDVAAPGASLSILSTGGLSVQDVVEAAGLSLQGNIEAVPGSGGVLTLFESDAVRQNRIEAGADGMGAYLRSTYSSGGTSALRFVLGASTSFTFRQGAPAESSTDVVTVGNFEDARGFKADLWRLTSSVSGNAIPISSGVSRVVGDGVTIADGVVTFAAPGLWKVTAVFAFASSGLVSGSGYGTIGTTENNGADWSEAVRVYMYAGAFSRCTGTGIHFFDVTDPSMQKVRFTAEGIGDNESIVGNPSSSRTYFLFERIAR